MSDKPVEYVEVRTPLAETCSQCGIPYRLLTGEEDRWVRQENPGLQPPTGTARVEFYACECDEVQIIYVRLNPKAPPQEPEAASIPSKPQPAWKRLLG